ncbi:MAG TPA: efflux RND transporter periplasmic adaptor subunit [Gemmatimonadaceae bacterium]|nr:efflux RND transporter periplasmic adaptor subunit [Gemmatimonadaceae bacterium]
MGLRFPYSIIAVASVAACGVAPATESAATVAVADPVQILVLRDTLVPDDVEAPATTEPVLSAVLSTKLMGRVMEVRVREGDVVAAGAVLVRLDDRDLAARREQADAGVRAADAAHNEARLQADRLRSLFADSAAPRAHLDAAEAGLVRAEQAVRGARAMAAEVEALTDYAEVRAPFGGVIVQSLVDPGAFVAPGMPLVRIEDPSRLRVVAAVPPSTASAVHRGSRVGVSIEGTSITGTVEGVVPVSGAALVNVQVLVGNASRRFSSGSAATVSVPGAPRKALLVPLTALVRNGDLAGVRVSVGGRPVTRWVRLGRERAGAVEVLSGLKAGDSIVVPAAPAGA